MRHFANLVAISSRVAISSTLLLPVRFDLVKVHEILEARQQITVRRSFSGLSLTSLAYMSFYKWVTRGRDSIAMIALQRRHDSWARWSQCWNSELRCQCWNSELR